MFHKEYRIYATTINGDIEEMAHDILSQIDTDGHILKLVFFHSPADNNEYIANRKALYKAVGEHHKQQSPLVSYVAQRPYGCTMLAEATYLVDTGIKVEQGDGFLLLSNGEARELITQSISANDIDAPTGTQADAIFNKIDNILKANGFTIDNIYRQWNYIEGITKVNANRQNYQEFNDARTRFYNKTQWSNGYPAATGIGTEKGGVGIEIMACNSHMRPNRAIDNPLQVSAHSYSQQVLAGDTPDKTTPKFERARMLCNNIYISGTAAIRGEHSMDKADTVAQAADTMYIMNHLVSAANIPGATDNSRYNILRVYVKQSAQIPAVEQFMNVHYPATQKYYVTADICREELLIEIEGIATVMR